MQTPLLISFYAGAQYYHDCAAALASRCDALGIPHDIENLETQGEVAWDAICRMKSGFIARKLREAGRPVVWVDVDTEILQRPDFFDGAPYDFAAFARDFRPPRDQLLRRRATARFFHPSVLFFNTTANGLAFAEEIAAFERTCELRVTDDYVLEQCWRDTALDLDIGMFAGERIVVGDAPATARTWFRHGRSDNVSEYVDLVRQHEALHGADTIGGVMIAEARDAQKSGDHAFALELLRRARHLAPTDDGVFWAWARADRHMHADSPKSRAIGAGERRLRRLAERRSARATEFARRLFLTAYLDGSAEVGLELTQAFAGDPTVGPVAAGFAPLFQAEGRAAAAGVAAEDRAKVWWMQSPFPGNFGDILTPWLLERLTGTPPRRAREKHAGLAIGSIVRFARTGTPVWGSGALRPSDTIAPDARYCAVRGPLTRDLARQAGGAAPDVLGDPALLAPRFYRPDVAKRHDLGVILHHEHRDLGLDAPDALSIDVLRAGDAGLEAFIREVLSCRRILSSSLHGLIVAHAYGVPAAWLDLNDRRGVPGGRFKFDDYFRSVGVADPPAMRWPDAGAVTAASVEPFVTEIVRAPDLDALAAACPFHPYRSERKAAAV